jgi:hypothetical protein
MTFRPAQSHQEPRAAGNACSVHPAALEPARLSAECNIRATRRSGPGGQKRNKVETAVMLTHRPTGLTAQASERRSQGENRRVALERLRRELALGMRTPPARDETGRIVPSTLWRSRLSGRRIAINPQHREFPALLAEALDVLAACHDEPVEAAQALGCTQSQFIRFLGLEPRALALLNERRGARGLSTFR